MADVVTNTAPPRVPTAQLLGAWGDALTRHAELVQAGNRGRELDDAVQVLEDAKEPLRARIQELERDRESIERLAQMDSITLGSRVGSPLRRWEKPRLQQLDALRQFLATLPPVKP